MKNKRKDEKNILINLEDTSKIKLENSLKEKDTITKNNQKTEQKTDKEMEIKEKKEDKKVKLTTTNDYTNNKSKFNIFLLIICLGILIYLGYKTYPKLDFNNYQVIIESLAFLIIIFITIIILFKFNSKKTIPYVLIITVILIIYTFFIPSYSLNNLYVSDFINKDIKEVMAFTDKYNLELNILHEYSDTVLKNHIIMQEYGINTLIKDIKTFNVTISDGPNYEKEVIVSNLTGFKYDDVMQYIKDNKLINVEIEFQKSDRERDTVIEQIGSGTLKRNDLIKFIFSYGPDEIEKIPVKDLKNLSLFEATSYLKRYNISYEIKYEYSLVEKGYVVSQDLVNQIVDTKLTLVVSKGKEVVVPDFWKMSSLEIANWGMENKIKIEYLEVFDKEHKSGDILNVSHTKSDKIDEDSKIIITISKGSMVMPDIKSINEFKLWAMENQIKYEEVYEFSDSIKVGELIKSSHQAGEKLTENETVVLTISKGKSVIVPRLIGLSKTNIQNQCQKIGLTCSFTYGGYTENTKKDISIKQSRANGSVVSEGTNILITLSSGIYEKVTVPSFIGKTKTEITNSCNNLGIKCNFVYSSNFSDVSKDKALSQSKTGIVIKGSSITITLSIGPAKTYTIVIDGSLLTGGNPEQTKKTLETKLKSACPGVNFTFIFQPANSGIGYLSPNSQVKVGSNTFVQGKTYQVIINSN